MTYNSPRVATLLRKSLEKSESTHDSDALADIAASPHACATFEDRSENSRICTVDITFNQCNLTRKGNENAGI